MMWYDVLYDVLWRVIVLCAMMGYDRAISKLGWITPFFKSVIWPGPISRFLISRYFQVHGTAAS